jgi:hypothetical protein
MRLPSDLLEPPRQEDALVLLQLHPHLQEDGASADLAGIALYRREQAIGDADAATPRQHREPPEIDAVILDFGLYGADEATFDLRDENVVRAEEFRDRLGGFLERARIGADAAAVLGEGRANDLRDDAALRGQGGADQDWGGGHLR